MCVCLCVLRLLNATFLSEIFDVFFLDCITFKNIFSMAVMSEAFQISALSWLRFIGITKPIGEKERHPLKDVIFTATDSSSVKVGAYRHRHVAYHNEHFLKTSTSMTLNVPEPQKGVL